jgi:hypothetical protein
MPTMRELSRWIRDYGQDAKNRQRLIGDRFLWHQLWAAMDIIEDVDSALDAYLDNEFPAALGERYLRIYGAMQALFLQQDALFDLVKVFHPTKEIQPNDVLKDIREARNASVGHPTRLKRKGTLSTHGIVQNSMNKDGFDLLSYPSKDDNIFQHVPVRELIEKQHAETLRILTEVINELREQEEVHRAQFRNTKLAGAFNLVSYAFEKIFEETRRDSARLQSRWAVGQLQQSLDEFAMSLKQRGLSIDTYESIEYVYEEIEHPLAELTKFVSGQSSEILSAKSALVFAEALQGYFERLRHMAGEIDEEYASEPAPIVAPELPFTPIIVTTRVIGE